MVDATGIEPAFSNWPTRALQKYPSHMAQVFRASGTSTALQIRRGEAEP